MKQESFRRFFGQSLFAPLSTSDTLVRDTNENPSFFQKANNGARVPIDGNVTSFAPVPLSLSQIYVLGNDGSLWLEEPPFGRVPPARKLVDGNVLAFEPINASNALVLGEDRTLWFEHGPWGTVPPKREQIDGNVDIFEFIDNNTVLVLGLDGALWLEHAPFGNVPPKREQVDGNVRAFQHMGDGTIYILGYDGVLWHAQAPFGSVPPNRRQVDGNVAAFDAISSNEVFVLSEDGTLWHEMGPRTTVPPGRARVDASVAAFWAFDGKVYVLSAIDGNLWLEQPPYGGPTINRSQIDQLPVTTYRFSLDSFNIDTTRSGNIFGTSKDTDYAAFALTVNNSPPMVVAQSMGDLGTGNYTTHLNFPRISILNPSDKISLSYHIINNSQGETTAMSYLRNMAFQLSSVAAKALATAIAGAIGAAIGAAIGTDVVPLIGSALGALAGWALSEAWGIAFPDCDGPVAAAVHVFTGQDLKNRTASGQSSTTDPNPGIDSPAGCGSNSQDMVTWSITHVT